MEPSMKAKELLDAAEEIARCGLGRIPAGDPKAIWILLVRTQESVIRLRDAVEAIRPFYTWDGPEKVWKQEADWDDRQAAE